MAKDPERGLEAVDAALALLERLKLPDSPSVGTIFLNAATALQSFGMTERALSLYGESSRIYQKHLAGDDKLKAGLFNNMAAAYVETGRFKEAEQHYLNALEILQKQGELMDSAVTFLNLAQLYRSWNNDPLLIRGMVECAMECFDSPQAQRDAYCAHTCRKCASGFGALGYGDIENELNSRADRYYAGH
jgi:tetratricopeptide (TPR) repeat protein